MSENNLPKEIEQFIKDEAEKYSQEKYPSLSDEKDDEGNHVVSDFEFNMQEANQSEIFDAVSFGATAMHTHLSESHEKEIAELRKELKDLKENNWITPKTVL